MFVFDLDGTLYRGEEPMPGAREKLSEIRFQGSLVRFVTNNSGATRRGVVAKLAGMGITAEEREVLTSGHAAAGLLVERRVQTVFVVGDPGLLETLLECGIEAVNRGRDGTAGASASKDAQAVVVGICRAFGYPLLAEAMQRVRTGALFVATNLDASYPAERGQLAPGAGAIVAAVQACSGVKPVLAGKPDGRLLRMILEDTGCRPEETLVVGDRLETDMEWGRAAGCATHLVLTGVADSPPDGQSWSQDLAGLPMSG